MLAVSAMSVALRVPEMCPALSGMSIKTSERIAKRMAANARTFKDGEYLWGDQPAATEAYVVQTGRVVSEVLELCRKLREACGGGAGEGGPKLTFSKDLLHFRRKEGGRGGNTKLLKVIKNRIRSLQYSLFKSYKKH